MRGFYARVTRAYRNGSPDQCACQNEKRLSTMAIRPYPEHLVSTWQAPDGTPVVIRPISPSDATLEREFVHALSAESKYMRFMSALNELTPAMLKSFTNVDYERDMALIAVLREPEERQIGVARYIADANGESCEFAIVVADPWQGSGLSLHLMRQLIASARERGLKTMVGQVLAANPKMLELAAALGFTIADTPHDRSLKEVRLGLAQR
jgi:acetyltransferase